MMIKFTISSYFNNLIVINKIFRFLKTAMNLECYLINSMNLLMMNFLEVLTLEILEE